jgi:hypothetical protein
MVREFDLGKHESPYFSETLDLSKLKVVTARLYAEQYKQGYAWATNCNAEAVQKSREEYEAKGLEVFVGEQAFDVYGKPTSGRCILVRKKK